MSYDYDWCGHVPAESSSPCGAPIERWSREWKHRKFELDADHKAVPQEPVGPLEEGLHLRADLTWRQAWNIDKVFWLGDTLKAITVALVAAAVHRAFPGLLRRSRPALATPAEDTVHA